MGLCSQKHDSINLGSIMMMKLMKGCASVVAGLATVVSAHAADLSASPAAAVDYVQVCDAYGSGFFTLPGGDTCLKVGGSVTVDMFASLHEKNVGLVPGLGWDRDINGIASRVDAGLTFEAITNTEFGPLQSYIGIRSRFETHQFANTTRLTDAWIKWNGMTVGLHRSFFTAYTGGSDVVFSSLAGIDRDQRNDFSNNSSARQEGKPLLAAYTAAFGNGFSASVSLELPIESRNPANTVFLPGNSYAGLRMPDVVANVRVDQAWGSLQAMGALHHVRSSRGFFAANGEHVDEIGYAFGIGGRLNIPGLPGASYIAGQAAFAHGATKYIDPSSPIADFRAGGLNGAVLTDSWGVAGTLNLGVSETVALQGSASFGRHDTGIVEADIWTAMADVTFSPVQGLAIRTGAEYREHRFKGVFGNTETGELVGFFRVARTF